MGPFIHGTYPILDRHLILPALRSAQIELIDRRETFRRLRIEFLREAAEKLWDRSRFHKSGCGLVAKRHRTRTGPRPKELLGKGLDNFRIIALATENIEIGPIRVIGEMAADERRLDELDH